MNKRTARYSKPNLFGLVALAAVGVSVPVGLGLADPPPNPECSNGWCGTPRQTGGGGGCGGGGGSILVNNTDDGKTYQYTDDFDADGVPDQIDNCPYVKNRDQLDSDSDKRGDACDNCAQAANDDQADVNGNGVGDRCDPDADSDGMTNEKDNCPFVPNPSQRDIDKDGQGDVCDLDMDGDGVPNATDVCPAKANVSQRSDDCDYDEDKDGVPNTVDNCPGLFNPDQLCTPRELDKELRCPAGRPGDVCNPDIDNDGRPNGVDNCAKKPNADQRDSDHDGQGDACDSKWCLVVARQDKNACLDPDSTFQVYSPTLPMLDDNGRVIEEERVVTGRSMRLRLFANRTNVAMRYNWIVQSRPSGSNAVVENPQGSSALSTPYEYHYLRDNVAAFTPDMPGRYVLKLTGEQVFADPLNASWPRNAEYLVTIEAEGDAMAGGCTAAPQRATGAQGAAGLGLGAATLMLGLLGLRRRARRAGGEG